MKPFVKIRIYPEITLEMLERVFGVDKLKTVLNQAKLDNDTITQATLQSQIDKAHTYLNPIVRILNEIKDGEPAYVKYHLDTEERLAHFFAQCYVEVGGAGFDLDENLIYGVDRLYSTFNQSFTEMGEDKNYENIKRAFEVGRLFSENKKGDLDQHHTETLKQYDENSEEYKAITNIIKARARKTPEIQKFQEIKNLLENSNTPTDNSQEFENLPKANEADQKGIANLVYWDKNRIEGYKLGNEEEGEGYKFIGRGMKQLTGKDNYQKLENWLRNNDLLKGEDSIMNNPELLQNEGEDYFFLSAVYFWNAKSIYLKARKPEPNESEDSIVDSVTAIVNKGTNEESKKARRNAYERNKGNGNLENSIFKDFRK